MPTKEDNVKEDPDINPCSYSQVIFDKRAQNTQWRKDSLFKTNVAGKTGYPNVED
jgi:hypothetical protein